MTSTPAISVSPGVPSPGTWPITLQELLLLAIPVATTVCLRGVGSIVGAMATLALAAGLAVRRERRHARIAVAVPGMPPAAATEAEPGFAESRLRFFHAAMESVDDVIVACRPSGEVIFLSNPARELLGLTRAADLPARWEGECDFCILEEHGSAAATDDPLLRALGGSVIAGERCAVMPRGGPAARTMLCHAHPVRNTAGGQIGAVLVMRDTTDWARMEQALRESEQRFHAFMDHTPAVAFIKDAEGRCVYMNRQMQQIFGLEALGRRDREWLPAEAAAVVEEHDQRVLKDGVPLKTVERIPCPGGGIADWLVLKFLMRDGRGQRLLGGVAIDITERSRTEEALRASEARLDRIASNVPGMVYQFLLTAAGESLFPFVSEGCRELFGLSSEEIIRHPGAILALIHPEDRAQYQCSVRESIATLLPWHWEGRVILHSGVEKWVQGGSRPERHANGDTLWDGILLDVTARKQAETLLLLSGAELERSNQALQDFAYVASHDLQEPLRKIRTFGEMLRESAGPTLAGDDGFLLDRIEHAATRMQTLIHDLLALSRVSTQPRVRDAVDLQRIAGDVVADLEARLAATGGRVHIAELPVVQGDATQMRQLLQNLIGNALKFHRAEHAPEVWVDARPLPMSSIPSPRAVQRWCELTVRDNGIGFEPGHAERIFAPFQRLHGREAYEGTGMGLSICRKIAEHHGGGIFAEGSPGEGASFLVRLPLAPLLAF